MKSTTMSQLNKAFQVNDTTGEGTYNFEDFEAVLGKAGLFTKRQELTKLFRHFDVNKTGTINYRPFITSLRGELSPRREEMIKKVFSVLAAGGDAASLSRFWECFNPKGHPQVKTGEKTEDDIAVAMRNTMAYCNISGDPNATLTWQEFHAIYLSMSSADPYDDDWFIASLSGCWGIAEGPADDMVNAAFLSKVRAAVFEKVRQRTTPNCQESETLRLTFKSIDLEEAGELDYDKFLVGLERFGVVLEEKVSMALFRAHQQNGTVNIVNFSQAVCQQL